MKGISEFFIKFFDSMAFPAVVMSGVIVALVIVADRKESQNKSYSEQWFGRYMDENKRCDSLQNEVWQLKRVNDSLKIELKYYEKN
jgi:hypothetical protein